MDTFEQQELRARQALSVSAIFKTTLTVGTVFFIMSGGSPWTTAGTMDKIMGRDLVGPGLWTMALGHYLVALLYVWVIGSVIYRLKTPAAVAIGVLIGIGLYYVNHLAFWALAGKMGQQGEFVVMFVHITFALFASLLYKAFSIPKQAAD